MRRRRPRLVKPPSTTPRSRRIWTAIGVVASVAILIGAPIVVLLLASSETVAEAPAVRPGSNDALRPSVPFFTNAGDGVRPDGIGCTGKGRVAVGGRAHLDVFADGRRVTVPRGIGVLPTCAYWLRTTRADGFVDIVSPERRSFTLGDLFDIWGAPLTRKRVLAFAVGPDRSVRVFVNGRRTTGNPRSTRLADGREIALVIGQEPDRIPSRFPGG